jgi:hypothetical protein
MPGRRELAALSRRLDYRVWKSAFGQRTFSAFQSHVRFWEKSGRRNDRLLTSVSQAHSGSTSVFELSELRS